MKKYLQPQTEITHLAFSKILCGSEPVPVSTPAKVGSNYVNGGGTSGKPSGAM